MKIITTITLDSQTGNYSVEFAAGKAEIDYSALCTALQEVITDLNKKYKKQKRSAIKPNKKGLN